MQKEIIRVIIVEDNEMDCLTITTILSHFDNLNILGIFSNALEAINSIYTLKPDLLFLDIEMPEISGIELLKSVRDQVPMAVFVTSYPDFALDGFELSALDYILKPLTEERFIPCLSRIEEYWEMRQKSNAYDILVEQDSLTIKQGHDKLKLPLSEVIYLEALNDYTKFYTAKKSYITLGNLSHILSQMPEDIFFRIHRSYAVAKSKITGLKKNEVICATISLPVGKTYKAKLDDYNLF